MKHEHTREVVERLLGLLGITYESVTASETNNKTAFVIKTKESQLLIGARGSHLTALNHLIKRIVGREASLEEGALDFYVDVNDYHDKLLREIKSKAEILAGRARSFKTNVEMDPMPPYERMIIHSLFQGVSDIKTESIGNGDKRRIVLKYVGDDITSV